MGGEDRDCSKGENHLQFQQKRCGRKPAVHVPLTSERQIKSPNYVALAKKRTEKKVKGDSSEEAVLIPYMQLTREAAELKGRAEKALLE